jgi:transcription elongation factor Elf1
MYLYHSEAQTDGKDGNMGNLILTLQCYKCNNQVTVSESLIDRVFEFSDWECSRCGEVREPFITKIEVEVDTYE